MPVPTIIASVEETSLPLLLFDVRALHQLAAG